jgi:hypothetical protein
MVLARCFGALLGAALLLIGGVSLAADYRPDEVFNLDLAKAVLSPKPLGPPAEFVPALVEGKGDLAKIDTHKSGANGSDANSTDANSTDANVDVAKTVPTMTAPALGGRATESAAHLAHKPASHHGITVAHARNEPRGAARSRLVHRHGNPLDAQARDTRVQAHIQTHIRTWPCNSGGICNWRQ